MKTNKKFFNKYSDRLLQALEPISQHYFLSRVTRYQMEITISRESQFLRNLPSRIYDTQFYDAFSFRAFLSSIRDSATCVCYTILTKHFWSASRKPKSHLLYLLSADYQDFVIQPKLQEIRRDVKPLQNHKHWIFSRVAASLPTSSYCLVIMSCAIVRLQTVGARKVFKSWLLITLSNFLYRQANRSLAKHFLFLVRFYRENSIALIVQSGDSSFRGSLSALAARKARVPYASVTHGYVADLVGTSIVPSFSSHLLCWSKAQAEWLTSLTVSAHRQFKYSRAICLDLGCPKKSRYQVKKFEKKIHKKLDLLVAFGGDYIESHLENKEYHENLIKFVSAISKISANAYVSIHPHDRNLTKLISVFRQFGYTIEHETTLKRPLAIHAAFCTSTSMHIELKNAGIPVMEISELKSKAGEYDYEATQIEVKNAESILKNIEELQRKNKVKKWKSVRLEGTKFVISRK